MAKFGLFCGEILHPTHALWCALRVIGTLAGALFKLHLAETEGHADRDAAAVVLRIGGGNHIRAAARLAPTVPVEDVARVDEDRQLAVEEVGTKTRIDAIASMTLAEQRLRG